MDKLCSNLMQEVHPMKKMHYIKHLRNNCRNPDIQFKIMTIYHRNFDKVGFQNILSKSKININHTQVMTSSFLLLTFFNDWGVKKECIYLYVQNKN